MLLLGTGLTASTPSYADLLRIWRFDSFLPNQYSEAILLDYDLKKGNSRLLRHGKLKTGYRFIPFTGRGTMPKLGLWTIHPGSAILEKTNCDHLLVHLQGFPLQMMELREYLESGARERHGSVVKHLVPSQITFLERIDRFSEKALIKKFGKIPEHAILDEEFQAFINYASAFNFGSGPDETEAPIPSEKKQYDVPTATSWLVSGQVAEKPAHLPFQLSEEGVVTHLLDRTQMKYAWEIGRVAQDKGSSLEENLFTMAHLMMQELAALPNDTDADLEAKIDQAFVFAHSLDSAHTKLYQAAYGMKVYPGYKSENPTRGEAMLYMPLRDFFKRFGERKTLLSNLVEDGTDFKNEWQNFWLANPKFIIDKKLASIRNFSTVTADHHLSPLDLDGLDSGDDRKSLPEVYRAKNAIEVRLQPGIKDVSPDENLDALTASVLTYARELQEAGEKDALKKLSAENVHIAIRSFNLRENAWLKAAGAEIVNLLLKPATYQLATFFRASFQRTPHEQLDVGFFSMTQILAHYTKRKSIIDAIPVDTTTPRHFLRIEERPL